MNLQGQQFGEFEILERLGQGGMGAVYSARQISLDRRVALKTLQGSLAEDGAFISRFKQEAKAAAGLNHPNLVQVYAAGETDGIHWFAMEYVEGESARGRLQREGRLPVLDAIAIVSHVATALDYGWKKAALIHRDIKPDNIFLSEDGQVKLGDLGLAKSLSHVSDLTETGNVMGTPLYMSPEQAQGLKTVDLRADIYSLGCTLYHFLVGHPPYRADSAVGIMLQHVSAPVPALSEAWPECPEDLADLVGRMMLKPAEDRPQSHEEVIAELYRVHQCLSGENEAPREHMAAAEPVAVEDEPLPPSSAEPAKVEPASRRRAVPVLVGLGILGIAAAGFFILKFKPQASSAGEKSVPATPAPMIHAAESTPAPAPETAAKPVPKIAASETPPAPPANTEATPVPMLVVSSAPAPSAPEPVTSATPAPAPASPAATPPASPEPKVAEEITKWLSQVDGPQQQEFQTAVLKPFELGVADLRARYLAALTTEINKASATGQLADALAWRTEKQDFEKRQNVGEDTDDTPPGVRNMRASFRQQLLKLDQQRKAQAAPLVAKYDAVLAKYETLLTQRQRLDDALLLKNKRDEIAKQWMAPPAIIEIPDPASVAVIPAVVPGASSAAVSANVSSPPERATKEAPFVNSLGMKFVPAGTPGTLFCIWDTRVQDYEAYAEASSIARTKAPYEQTPLHPVTMVSWAEANAFCQWLSQKENRTYRLPTDAEWSAAVGKQKFPWGATWPPPKESGNFTDETARKAGVGSKTALTGYDDGYVNTSPVGTFSPNKYGLYDMAGNVTQWVEDIYRAEMNDSQVLKEHPTLKKDLDSNGAPLRTLRGSSFFLSSDESSLLSSRRNPGAPGTEYIASGFRVVLAVPPR